MSIRVMTAVFDHSKSRLADRLVLLVIADKSDDDGSGCFRGRQSIADMAGVSASQVTVSIKRLQELGELEVVPRAGRSHLYRVVLAPSQNLSGSAFDPDEDLSPTLTDGCETPSHTGVTDTSSYPSSHAPAIASQEEPTPEELEAGRAVAARALRQTRAAHHLESRLAAVSGATGSTK